MNRVEMIPKTSVLNDILDQWKKTGRTYNENEGEFIFDSVESAHVENGVLRIFAGNKTYFYNMSDFYRVKVMEVVQPELFDD